MALQYRPISSFYTTIPPTPNLFLSVGPVISITNFVLFSFNPIHWISNRLKIAHVRRVCTAQIAFAANEALPLNIIVDDHCDQQQPFICYMWWWFVFQHVIFPLFYVCWFDPFELYISTFTYSNANLRIHQCTIFIWSVSHNFFTLSRFVIRCF